MAKAASKSTKKASATPPVPPKPPTVPHPHPLYAAPIKEAAASGDLKGMKSMAAKGRKHIAEVNAALAKLDKAITKAGG